MGPPSERLPAASSDADDDQSSRLTTEIERGTQTDWRLRQNFSTTNGTHPHPRNPAPSPHWRRLPAEKPKVSCPRYALPYRQPAPTETARRAPAAPTSNQSPNRPLRERDNMSFTDLTSFTNSRPISLTDTLLAPPCAW